jgi:hypothetical protein
VVKAASVFGVAGAIRADAAKVGAEAAAPAAGHHEAQAVVDVGVEGEAVRTADEPDVVGAQESEELGLAAPEAPASARTDHSTCSEFGSGM